MFCTTELNSRLLSPLIPATYNQFYWNYSVKRRNELTLWTWEMEGEDKEEEHNERDGDVEVGAGIGLNQGVSSLRRHILLHYWWKWMAEGFGKARYWAVSACHVTLIDTALVVAQAPIRPGLRFQFAPWFIYRDTRLNNHWGSSGLSCGLCNVALSKSRVVSL